MQGTHTHTHTHTQTGHFNVMKHVSAKNSLTGSNHARKHLVSKSYAAQSIFCKNSLYIYLDECKNILIAKISQHTGATWYCTHVRNRITHVRNWITKNYYSKGKKIQSPIKNLGS